MKNKLIFDGTNIQGHEILFEIISLIEEKIKKKSWLNKSHAKLQCCASSCGASTKTMPADGYHGFKAPQQSLIPPISNLSFPIVHHNTTIS